ncbi:uncharacterized protein SETTUDRAFT_35191 [Exserohilum turcica Et28A]|uniref:Uncharacterized protein n=1 Tax=Exserohilum turcicum (strain 28A) TaxID=671987 RepID=R0I797_EXST2|nr:uncharacterized protein SETTUDRAFT_35191 [Exserohilum turcica Et28A]EOA81346.1 hypothetical protein SETTUDRAFT_35191 [Exserohilum turcica Et28A]
MALALRTLHALKTLALGFQTPLPTRFVPRSHVAAQRTQQHLAWKTLVDGGPPVWSRRLRSLRLEDAEIETAQLGMLVSESAACDELVLEGCRNLGKEVWCELQMWIGRGRVRVLEVAECGGVLGEKALDGIGGMGGLERLNLYDCREAQPGLMQRCNSTVWRIPHFVAPRPTTRGADMVIEVDPEYIA